MAAKAGEGKAAMGPPSECRPRSPPSPHRSPRLGSPVQEWIKSVHELERAGQPHLEDYYAVSLPKESDAKPKINGIVSELQRATESAARQSRRERRQLHSASDERKRQSHVGGRQSRGATRGSSRVEREMRLPILQQHDLSAPGPLPVIGEESPAVLQSEMHIRYYHYKDEEHYSPRRQQVGHTSVSPQTHKQELPRISTTKPATRSPADRARNPYTATVVPPPELPRPRTKCPPPHTNRGHKTARAEPLPLLLQRSPLAKSLVQEMYEQKGRAELWKKLEQETAHKKGMKGVLLVELSMPEGGGEDLSSSGRPGSRYVVELRVMTGGGGARFRGHLGSMSARGEDDARRRTRQVAVVPLFEGPSSERVSLHPFHVDDIHSESLSVSLMQVSSPHSTRTAAPSQSQHSRSSPNLFPSGEQQGPTVIHSRHIPLQQIVTHPPRAKPIEGALTNPSPPFFALPFRLGFFSEAAWKDVEDRMSAGETLDPFEGLGESIKGERESVLPRRPSARKSVAAPQPPPSARRRSYKPRTKLHHRGDDAGAPPSIAPPPERMGKGEVSKASAGLKKRRQLKVVKYEDNRNDQIGEAPRSHADTETLPIRDGEDDETPPPEAVVASEVLGEICRRATGDFEKMAEETEAVPAHQQEPPHSRQPDNDNDNDDNSPQQLFDDGMDDIFVVLECAIKLQAFARAALARKRFRKLRRAMQVMAALRIQRRWLTKKRREHGGGEDDGGTVVVDEKIVAGGGSA
ncbi:unnamed protein product [Vitrella brassicaformis CCMP3155]|uniref:Uncharacterized protein n=2 Tax=Vitrella brassicaformis TaxID=1169539 RepID=A0A0G4GWJ8_VITBC|nr:unnamed protein product [Vitrella brassicaformis CCMP3155]|eukprot:CEM35312.1 unnamed protein product [Vitrella brassicaformis CCMP3155]